MSVISNVKRRIRSSDFEIRFGCIYIITLTCGACQDKNKCFGCPPKITKIGKADASDSKATDSRRRIKSYFATKYPDYHNIVATLTCLNYNEAERQIHQFFSKYRHRSEWFNFDSTPFTLSDDSIPPLDKGVDYSKFVPNDVMRQIIKIITDLNKNATL